MFASKKLANYVRLHAVFAMLSATVLLWALNVSLAFLSELDNLKAGYGFFDALRYILWRSPQYLYEFLPMATLVGAVVGLGNLASHSELTVMRAAGVSLYRIVSWVVQAVVMLVLLALLLSQYVLPYTNAKAKLTKHPESKALLSEVNGFWTKQQALPQSATPANPPASSQLVYVDYANADGNILKLTAWQIDAKDRIQEVMTAKAGKYQQQNQWLLDDVSVLSIKENGGSMRTQYKQLTKTLPLQPQYIYLMTRPVDDLSISDLYTYNHYLSEQGKASAEHKLAFWQKLLSPLAFLSLVLIACSFVFGSLRQQSMGLRIVIAILCGLVFRYVQNLTAYMGLVYPVSPLWFVVLPIILSAMLGIFLLNRKR